MLTRRDSTKTIVLIIAAVICLLSYAPFLPAQSEADVVAAITKPGKGRGSVEKDGQGHVIGILLVGSSDERIESIDFSVLTRLESLTILSGQLTSRSLVQLRKIRKGGLQTLGLIDSVSDDGELPALLKEQQSLILLKLSKTRVSDKTLAAIGTLEELSCLDLSRTDTTDAGLKQLTNMENLGILVLSNTKITDVGMREIGKIRDLKSLLIEDTVVTDKGIHELAGLELLNYVGVNRTKVTDRGKESFQKLCPNVVFRLP